MGWWRGGTWLSGSAGVMMWLSFAASAAAQSADTATAESLFEQGRDLLRAGKAAEACPKLAESQRLDPATGTLLALAMCDEANSKLATAWSEFVDAEARSRHEARADRQQVAHDHATALRPRLSTLEVRVPAEVAALAGVEVRRDGQLVGRGAWNVAVPIDGAQHSVEVRATGKLTWTGTKLVRPDSDVALIEVPALADAPVEATTGGRQPSPLVAIEHSGPRPWKGLEWAGVSVVGAGVVTLGVGGYFLLSALGKQSDSNHDCAGNACGPDGFTTRTTAVSRGNTATILGITGGVLAAGGATLFIIGRTRKPTETAARVQRSFSFGGSTEGVGARFSTQF